MGAKTDKSNGTYRGRATAAAILKGFAPKTPRSEVVSSDELEQFLQTPEGIARERSLVRSTNGAFHLRVKFSSSEL